MMLFSHQIATFAKRDIGTRAPMTAAALGVVVLLAFGGVAGAENECGAPEPGVELTCSPSNYDSAEDGNIFYGPDESNGDFTIRLTDDLVLDYDREAPGDDFYSLPGDPESRRYYSAVWISPTETGYGYTGAISVFSSADVTSNARGIFVGHYGESGALRMELTGGNFTTMGERAYAIHSYHEGAGNIDIIARNLTVNTNGPFADGIAGEHRGEGDINIDVRDATFTVTGESAGGIYAWHGGEKGNVNVDAQGLTIAVNGRESRGVFVHQGGEGDSNVTLRDVTIIAQGFNGRGIHSQHVGTGDVDIDVQGGAITTDGAESHGLVAVHAGTGDINVDAQGLTIAANGRQSRGVSVGQEGEGDVHIDVRGSRITTRGVNSHGIYAEHDSGIGEIRIVVDGGTIHAAGLDASGIQIGRLNEEGMVERAAALGEDGYRKQSVTVNGRVWGGTGAAAGVYLAGGGKLTIGPRGTIGAESGWRFARRELHSTLPERHASPSCTSTRILRAAGWRASFRAISETTEVRPPS